ncbi:MAG TPA: DinB family protein [Pyrinomonadaceae bacterium]|nr:DinB family protein [Pyrinomonadaceae bacterium]
MGLGESMLPEFDHEMANTRRTLERIPEDKLDWKPHEKSTTMGGLATHLSNLASWAVLMIDKDEFDAAPEGQPLRAKPVESVQEALETFDKNVAAAREAIKGASDEHLMKTWTLLAAGRTIFTQPRAGVLRGFIMNHTIHHRAQLSVYLRLNDVPVPSLYGPSADEGAFM